MNYNIAKTSTRSTPCTNVPIHCPLCLPSRSGSPRSIWKYNAMYHLASEHSSITSADLPNDYPSFIVNTFIQKKEESWLGIPEETTLQYRGENEMLNTDAVMDIKAEVDAQLQQKSSAKRTRDVLSEIGSTRSLVKTRQKI